ncbi:right-handed parallel beta-helix repeat-containing protein [Quadrisphaera sp. KR29]|uniref:right-handed parallel beta-helix repeat-containing protein n=1 Tax=Quadrisphaera sp. KR29 TaxID=3461391 RepID=UPI0040445917
MALPSRRTVLRAGVAAVGTALAAGPVGEALVRQRAEQAAVTPSATATPGPSVSADDFRAPADGTTDATAALQRALDAGRGGQVHLREGARYRVRSLTVPPSTALVGHGASLLATPGADVGAVLVLGSSCSASDLTVDGGAPARGPRPGGDWGASAVGPSCVAGSGTRVRLRRLQLRNAGGHGVVLSGCRAFSVREVTVTNATQQGVAVVFSSHGVVSGCTVEGADHGIQFWGGDAAKEPLGTGGDPAHAVVGLTISGNTVRDVTGGGIWGSRGRAVVVRDNTVERCGDVGVDFEGCTASRATGNRVTDAGNAGLAVFYGSTACTFARNRVVQSGAGAGFRAFGGGTSTGVVVRENTFDVAQAAALHLDEGACTGSTFSGNTATVRAPGVYALRSVRNDDNAVTGNTFSNAAPTCIANEGGSGVTIADNRLTCTRPVTATSPGWGGGVLALYSSAEHPGQRCTIRGNTAVGYPVGVCDGNWSQDRRSFNVIEDNAVDVVVHFAGRDYSGRISGNTSPRDQRPATVTSL